MMKQLAANANVAIASAFVDFVPKPALDHVTATMKMLGNRFNRCNMKITRTAPVSHRSECNLLAAATPGSITSRDLSGAHYQRRGTHYRRIGILCL
jgi:hypothetical protein